MEYCKHEKSIISKCEGCEKEAKGSESALALGSKAFYWIDFKHKRHAEEIRLLVEAENLEDARKKAVAYVSKRFKFTKACCVR